MWPRVVSICCYARSPALQNLQLTSHIMTSSKLNNARIRGSLHGVAEEESIRGRGGAVLG